VRRKEERKERRGEDRQDEFQQVKLNSIPRKIHSPGVLLYLCNTPAGRDTFLRDDS